MYIKIELIELNIYYLKENIFYIIIVQKIFYEMNKNKRI